MLTYADVVQEAVSDGNAARESLGKQVLQVHLCLYLCLLIPAAAPAPAPAAGLCVLMPATAAAAGGLAAAGGEYER